MDNLEVRDKIEGVKASLWMLYALLAASEADLETASSGMALTLSGVLEDLTEIDEALSEGAE